MIECTWVGPDGRQLPLEECTKEQLIDRFRAVVASHHDALVANEGAMKALQKRLQDHRKAKAEANKRADQALRALKAVIAEFEVKT